MRVVERYTTSCCHEKNDEALPYSFSRLRDHPSASKIPLVLVLSSPLILFFHLMTVYLATLREAAHLDVFPLEISAKTPVTKLKASGPAMTTSPTAIAAMRRRFQRLIYWDRGQAANHNASGYFTCCTFFQSIF